MTDPDGPNPLPYGTTLMTLQQMRVYLLQRGYSLETAFITVNTFANSKTLPWGFDSDGQPVYAVQPVAQTLIVRTGGKEWQT